MALTRLELFFGQPFTLVLLATALDLFLGDPVYAWHPIRCIGRLLQRLERGLRRVKLNGYGGGILLFLLLGTISVGIVEGIFLFLSQLHWAAGFIWHLFIAWQMIAIRDLCRHGRDVAVAVNRGDLMEARRRSACLVGRDTERMDGHDCCRAALESLAENLTDGIIAPLFYFAIFGIPGLVLFKVVSTMDSMVGYRNERYRRFGCFGARADDLLNYIPARLTWLLMSAASFLLPGYSARGCLKIGWQQHAILPGPNSGWTEAGAAGALNRRLVGKIWRDGKLAVDQWIGSPESPTETSPADLTRMILLVHVVSLGFIFLTYLLVFLPGWQLWPVYFPARALTLSAFIHPGTAYIAN